MRTATGLCLGLFGLACAAEDARAADWRIGASITERFNYDTNIRLSTDNEEEVWGFSTLPSVTVEGRTPRLRLSLDAGLDYTFYEGADDLDSFDQRGSAGIGYDWERARVNFAGSVVHAATRETELEDTGLVFTDANRLIFTGRGSWSYLISQRDRLGIRGNGSRSVADTSIIRDYTSYGGGVFWERQLTEEDTLEFSGSYNRYVRTSGLHLESDTVGGQVSYGHAFSPQFKATIYGGGRYTTTDEDVFDGINIVSREDSSSGAVGGLSFSYLIERGRLEASYSRSVDPSGTGQLENRDTVGLSAEYRMTPDISLDFAGNFIRQQSVDDSVDDGRKYINAEPGVNWNFYRNLFFRVSYRYRTQKFEFIDDWAVSHSALASLSWRMPAEALVADN